MTLHEIVFGRKVRFPTEFSVENVPKTYVELVYDILNRIVKTESLAVVAKNSIIVKLTREILNLISTSICFDRR